MLKKIKDSSDFIKNHISECPKIAIILGTGLSNFTKQIDIIETIPYSEIPNFKKSTVAGHEGRLIYGTVEGIPILAMQGRFHYYEGYSMAEVTFPIRVMKELGIKSLLVSNAAGGLNPQYTPGDIMVITDHINLFPEHPLRGNNIDELGPRFPDMSNAYDKAFVKIAE